MFKFPEEGEIASEKKLVPLRGISRRETMTDKKGLPLGNLTSQLFVNIYMNEFDQFMKHKIRAKYYIRYADDFAVFSDDRDWLECILTKVSGFLTEKLRLTVHPDKIFLKTLTSGVDFLGWIYFPDHRILRTTTKKRMFKKISERPERLVIQSYKGLMSHGNGYNLIKKINNMSHESFNDFHGQ